MTNILEQEKEKNKQMGHQTKNKNKLMNKIDAGTLYHEQTDESQKAGRGWLVERD